MLYPGCTKITISHEKDLVSFSAGAFPPPGLTWVASWRILRLTSVLSPCRVQAGLTWSTPVMAWCMAPGCPAVDAGSQGLHHEGREVPMALQLNHVHLKTHDPEKTAQFYADTLGATIVGKVGTNGYRLDLHGLALN